jgi:thiamine transport system ATP-binding protein
MPGSLSGGERQRVALARTLVRDLPVLLMDEPFAALGPGLRNDMIALIRDLQSEKHMTVLVVTHQPEDARRMADEILFLSAGRIAGQGRSPEFLDRTDIEGLADYLGQKGA